MTKSPLLFFFGCVLGVFGASTTPVHVLNIERAIVGLEANMASNSVSETHYVFDRGMLQSDCARMPHIDQCNRMAMVRKELGRYPKWYKAEKNATERMDSP